MEQEDIAMEELKPRPFCGGEAELVIGAHRDGGYIENCACVRCKKCGARSCEFHECVTPDEVQGYASETWNRRAERTCRVEEDTKRASQTQLVVTKSCSECGHCFGAETHYERMFEGMVLNEIELPRYCPNCGAKVVDE